MRYFCDFPLFSFQMFSSVCSMFMLCRNSRRAVSVNDIRRAFEKAEQSLSHSGGGGGGTPKRSGMSGSSMTGVVGSGSSSHNRMSSLDSTTSSEESSIPTPHFHGSVTSLASGHGGDRLKDHYGSITSLASSTSMISPQVSPTIVIIPSVSSIFISS